MNKLLNLILFRGFRRNRAAKAFASCLESEAADGFLTILLHFMSLSFLVDREFRKSIADFTASYYFTTQDGNMSVTALFDKGKLKVRDPKPDNPTFTLIFKDGKSLVNFLLSPAPDILNALLNQEIDFFGSINYINKFAYLAIHLRNALLPS
jgi:hypothetical protein